MGLWEDIIRGIFGYGYVKPTQVQSKSIIAML
jgi:superfamily II DNA/RNA helicase